MTQEKDQAWWVGVEQETVSSSLNSWIWGASERHSGEVVENKWNSRGATVKQTWICSPHSATYHPWDLGQVFKSSHASLSPSVNGDSNNSTSTELLWSSNENTHQTNCRYLVGVKWGDVGRGRESRLRWLFIFFFCQLNFYKNVYVITGTQKKQNKIWK